MLPQGPAWWRQASNLIARVNSKPKREASIIVLYLGFNDANATAGS